MKLYKKYLLIAFLLMLVSSVFAGLPHNVYVEVCIDQANNHPQSLTFNAWIVGRESERLTETSGGCGYIAEEGLLFVQVGTFPTSWSANDILHIEVTEPCLGGSGEFQITNNGGDFYGPSHFDSDGIYLLCWNKNDFHSDKHTISLDEDVHFTTPEMGNIVEWQWDFDNDGKIDSTDKNPIYKYKNAGKYTVKLLIKDKTGKTTTLIQKNCVEVKGK